MDIPLRAETITLTPAHYDDRPPDQRRSYDVAVADVPLRVAIQASTFNRVGDAVGDHDIAFVMERVLPQVYETDAAREDATRIIASWLAEDEPRRAALLHGDIIDDSPEYRLLNREFGILKKELTGYSERVRKLVAQKEAHNRIQHIETLSACLRGWSGPDLPEFRSVNGRVPYQLLTDAFERTDTSAAIDANLIWMEAWRHMIVTPQEKKVSDSP